jgi:hypothetical protein
MPGPQTTQLTDPQPSKTCYDCGYKCTDMVRLTWPRQSFTSHPQKDWNCTPEPIDKEGHVNFCGNLTSMSSQTKKCSRADDCCGAVREYFEV